MADFSNNETRTARKNYRCLHCWQPIKAGEKYVRYAGFDGGDVWTCRLHPECQKAIDDAYPYEAEGIPPGSDPRGCTCGFDRGCKRCKADPESWLNKEAAHA